MMKVSPTLIPDVLMVEPDVFGDPRGFFLESWSRRDLEAGGIAVDFVQDNHSHSLRGTLRGLHYQVRSPQGKLVRVVRGEVFDVAVDLRKSSPNFGQWVGLVLSAENHRMLWIPPGFAHGFYVLSPQADFLYKSTAYYSPEDGRTIAWDDPDLAIEWPLSDSVDPTLSENDQQGTPFSSAELFS